MLLLPFRSSSVRVPEVFAPKTWRWRLLVLAVLWGVLAPPAQALPDWARRDEPVFRHLGREQGLPSSVTYSLAQDAQGFVWIGTVSGLARWDGHKAQVFRPDPHKPGSLPDGWVQALLTDGQGRLWVGTGSGGLSRWDAEQQRFHTLGAEGDGGAALSHPNVHALQLDGAGGLWVATDGGLDHLDLARLSVRRHADAGAALQGLPRLRINALLRSRSGSLWVGTSQGVFRSRAGGAGFEPVPLQGPEVPAVLALHEDSAGRVWVGTAARGAFVWLPGAVQAQAVELPGAPELPGQHVAHIQELRPGHVWLGTLGQGLVVLELGTGPGLDAVAQARARPVRHRPGWRRSLGDDTVRTMLRDRSGLMWVGTDGGVSLHDSTQVALLTLLGLPGSIDETTAEISALRVASDGQLWVGTHKHGVTVVPAGSAATAATALTLRPDRQHPDTALPQDIVLALAEGPRGEMYVATKRGLYRASADGRSVQRLRSPLRDPAAAVWSMLRVDGTLWLGGATDGLWALDLASGQWRHVAHQDQADAVWRLTDDRVTALAPASGGGLWVGSRQGLDRLDPEHGIVARWQAGKGVAAALPGGFVTALWPDPRGRLWIGTYGGGVSVLDAPHRPGQALRHLTEAQGLPADSVNMLVADGRGRVWVSTDNGLAVIDPDTLRVRGLHDSDGAAFTVYWTGSGAQLPGGELVFGGAGGMTLVQPDALREWRYLPPLALTALRVGGQPRPPVLPPDHTLVLPPDANHVRVEFASLDYSDPQRQRYAARLEGHDADWVEVDAEHRQVSYGNLAPGRYKLELRGSNRNGVWADPPLALTLEVQPAWHQTWLFRGLSLLVLLGTGLLALRLRERGLQQRQAELEAAVDQRTLQLRELTRQLEAQSRALEAASLTDPLTGLHNRRHLVQALQGRAGTRPMALLLIDVDHFKQVNDGRGHAAGDAALVALAQLLTDRVPPGGELVRWGGEEFLLVARELGPEDALHLAEQLRAEVAAAPLVLPGHGQLPMTLSVGLACLPFVAAAPQALDWEAVLGLADQALYAAKRLGRNRCVGLAGGPALQAPAAAAGLAMRVHADPEGCVQRGELRVLCQAADEAQAVQALRV